MKDNSSKQYRISAIRKNWNLKLPVTLNPAVPRRALDLCHIYTD